MLNLIQSTKVKFLSIGDIDTYEGPGMAHLGPIRDLRDSIVKSYGVDTSIDWEIVHNAGCTCDDTELPHHVSTLEEAWEMIKEMGVHLREWTSK